GNTATIAQVPSPRQSNLNQFVLGKLDQVAVARLPESIMFEAEIFEAVANFVGLGHHLRRPGAEVLNATNLDAWIVNVDPVVIKHAPIFQDQHHGEEIAVLETFSSMLRSLAHVR